MMQCLFVTRMIIPSPTWVVKPLMILPPRSVYTHRLKQRKYRVFWAQVVPHVHYLAHPLTIACGLQSDPQPQRSVVQD